MRWVDDYARRGQTFTFRTQFQHSTDGYALVADVNTHFAIAWKRAVGRDTLPHPTIPVSYWRRYMNWWMNAQITGKIASKGERISLLSPWRVGAA
ncbi:hypothetical protein ACOSOMT5_P0526 [Acidiphilium sp. MT5]